MKVHSKPLTQHKPSAPLIQSMSPFPGITTS